MDHVARAALIRVGELVKEIGEGTVPLADEPAGSSLAVHVEERRVLQLAFAGGGGLNWDVRDHPGAGERGDERSLISRPRDGVYAVDCVLGAR